MKDESLLFTLIIFWIGIECSNYPPESEVFTGIGRFEKTYFLKSLWKSSNTDDIILQISTNVQKIGWACLPHLVPNSELRRTT